MLRSCSLAGYFQSAVRNLRLRANAGERRKKDGREQTGDTQEVADKGPNRQSGSPADGIGDRGLTGQCFGDSAEQTKATVRTAVSFDNHLRAARNNQIATLLLHGGRSCLLPEKCTACRAAAAKARVKAPAKVDFILQIGLSLDRRNKSDSSSWMSRTVASDNKADDSTKWNKMEQNLRAISVDLYISCYI
jgi:hypothetical protein